MPATEPLTDQPVIGDTTVDITEVADDESHLVRGYD
ncbi:hypothetical protein FB470_004143 [Amycolatopsis thermophila]|uniref:Uncharacterized protein n=1 Tax=Amycolatopsis thermophila TaxID=206084 RepID=A0ABU0EXU6_9PSEU|nr:hypothetical protein [Amycolatopsis thermophila]